ncbi:MAG TPA: response regulator [Longimicrobiaceae bacterium]
MSEQRASVPSVLLVEDNETIRDAFRILLEDSGYVVHEAASGQEAVDKATHHPPAVMLLDLGLPDINGLDVARRIRAEPSTAHVPIVALTGRALETDEKACLEAGCTAYLSKPIDSAALLRKIGEVVGGMAGS